MQKSLRVIRYLILGGVFLSPFLVLIVSSSMFFPFITGKNFVFRILVEIIFGLWCVLAIFDKKYRPKRSWILTFLLSFTFVLILSTIFGANPYRSFWSNYERMEGLLAYLHLLAFFVVLISTVKTERIWNWFLHTSLGISIMVGIYGLLQVAGKLAIHQSSTRLDATLGNASYLAIYMVFHIFLAAFFFFRWLERYRLARNASQSRIAMVGGWFYLPVFVLNSVILYYTATRGAILGFVGGIMLAIILVTFLSSNKKIKIAGASLFLVSLVLLGSLWVFRDSSFVQQSQALSRIARISLNDRTTQSRFIIWKMGWKGFKERPILGWGPENFNLVFNKHYEPILWKQEAWFDRAHNVFVDRLATNGILGLFTYLGLFMSAVYYILFKRKQLGFSIYDSAILTSLFVAYFFNNLFVFDNIISSILFFTFLAYVAVKLESSQIPAKDDSFIRATGPKLAYASIASIAVIFVLYFVNVPSILTSKSMIDAFKFTSQGKAQESFESFQKAIQYDSFGSTEAREHLINFSMQILNEPNIDNNFKTEVVNFTVSEMQKQIEQAPDDIRYMLFLSGLYSQAGKYDEATALLQKAIELSPRKQQLYFSLGTAYLNNKEFDKGFEVFKTAFELEPSFFEARKLYAVSAIYAGENDLFKELMKDSGDDIYSDYRFVNAFASTEQYDKVVSIWKKLIEGEPNNPQYRISLASSYLSLGERQKAIEQIGKAIEFEPSFKEQGEYYISEIRAGRNP